MTSYNVPFFYQRFYDNNGLPLAGGRIYTYVAGTSIPKPLYHDFGLVDPITQPMVLDANGVAPEYFAKAGMYKFEIRSFEDELVATRDYVTPTGEAGGAIDPQDIAFKSENNIFLAQNTFSAGLSATEIHTQDITVTEDLIIDPASNGVMAFPQKDEGFLYWDTGLGDTVTVPQADLPFVDKTSDESVGGIKTFNDGINTSSISADVGININYALGDEYNIAGDFAGIVLEHPYQVEVRAPTLHTSGVRVGNDSNLVLGRYSTPSPGNDRLLIVEDDGKVVAREALSASEILSVNQKTIGSTGTAVIFGRTYKTIVMPDGKEWLSEDLIATGFGGRPWQDNNAYADRGLYYSRTQRDAIKAALQDGWRVPFGDSDWTNLFTIVGYWDQSSLRLRDPRYYNANNSLGLNLNFRSMFWANSWIAFRYADPDSPLAQTNLDASFNYHSSEPMGSAGGDQTSYLTIPYISNTGGPAYDTGYAIPIRLVRDLPSNATVQYDLDYLYNVIENINPENNYVAISGDTMTGNLQAPSFSVNKSSNVSVGSGQIAWNDTEKTFDMGLEGGTVLQAGQELVLYGHNETGSTITNGQAVYITSASTPDGSLHFGIPSRDNANTFNTIAIATQNIANGASGYATKYGKVRDINTSAFVEGQKVYLGINGAITSAQAIYPEHSIELGYCVISHPTSGSMYVDISNEFAIEDLYNVKLTNVGAGDSLIYEDNKWINRNFGNISKEYTGFKDPELVTVDYNPSTRKVTLSGSVEAYYRSKSFPTLSAGWVSPAHPAGVSATQFLMYDGTNIIFSSVPFDYSYIQIAAVVFAPNGEYICTIREPHGVLSWQAHQEFHDTLGTYLKTGGDISSYVLNSTTAADRRPDISTTVLHDEDLPTTNSALTSKIYSRFSLSGSNTMVFTSGTSDIINVTGNVPNWNEFNGSTWVQTPFSTNAYGAVFVFSVPAALDAKSQSLRYVFVQPQTVSTNLDTIKALTPSNVNLSSFANLNPEICFVGKIIVRHTAANWQLISVERLSGTKVSQTSSTGIFLSIVTTDTTLAGLGTAASPLGIDLADFGTW